MAEEFQQWILVLSGAVTLLSLTLGIWLSLREYRLKLQSVAIDALHDADPSPAAVTYRDALRSSAVPPAPS